MRELLPNNWGPWSFRIWMLLLFLPLAAIHSYAQTERLEGVVTFVTSKNVYVSFDITAQIQVGDTLTVANSPCLVVSNKSSSSVVCVKVGNCELERETVVSTSIVSQIQQSEQVVEPNSEEELATSSPEEEVGVPETPQDRPKEKIWGRISVSEYSNIGSKRDDRHRLMTRLAFDVENINHSKFSFESFLTYRHIFPTNPDDFSPNTSFFRVYNLALKYEASPTLSVLLGRRINPKIASLGAIDGLQVEQYFGNNYVGAIIGSRPDISTHAFNANLLEYGGYIGRESKTRQIYSQTTLGAIEQRNGGKIDRRYAYFQHSSTIGRRLNLFSSLEMDMYSSINGITSNEIRLPNLFASARYRFGRIADVMLSYDSRKRILYYETLQTEIERLLDDDLARQGIRARINVRPVKYVRIGASFARRFQSDNQNQSDNLHASASWSKIPVIGGRLSATFNQNTSNYLTSNIFSFRHSRTLVEDKLHADVYYRLASYTFVNSERVRTQHYYGANLAFRIMPKLVFSVSGEYATFNGENNYRLYVRLIQRFYRGERMNMNQNIVKRLIAHFWQTKGNNSSHTLRLPSQGSWPIGTIGLRDREDSSRRLIPPTNPEDSPPPLRREVSGLIGFFVIGDSDKRFVMRQLLSFAQNRFLWSGLFSCFVLLATSCGDNPKVISANPGSSPVSPTNSGIFTEPSNSSAPTSKSLSSSFSDQVHKVVVNEVLPTSKYVYLHVTEGVQQYWIATRKQQIQEGGTYYYRDGLLKTNFESKEYNRVFDRILLVSKLVSQNHGGQSGLLKSGPIAAGSSPRPSQPQVSPPKTSSTEVIRIADLVANPQAYQGKTVQIKGTCIKVNPNIMNRNWVHLQDGSKNEFDLVVTTTAHVHEGDQVSMQATVALNRNFGAGYAYDLILENGVVVK